MIISNNKYNISNTHALYNFLNNLEIDGSYTINKSALIQSYNLIDDKYKNGDLMLLAGAYKTGAIACYDREGNIIDLGFSRSGSAYGFVHGVANDYPTNTPVLDEFHYRTSILGYLVEDTKDYYIRCGNNSRTITSPNNVDIVNNGSVDFHNPIQIVERDDASAVVHSFNVPVRYGQEESSLVDYQSIIRLSDFLNFDNSTVDSLSLSRSIWNQHAFTFHKGLPPIRNGSGQTVGMMNHPNRYLNFDYNEAWSAFRPTLNTTNDISIHNLGNYSGQLGKYTSIMPFYNNISAPITRAIVDIINEVPLKFASSSTYLGSDIIAPITLLSDATIYIKTVKGVQEFTLPTGVLNINDYVVNDKLIAVSINYSNLENNKLKKFNDNLLADGTYIIHEDILNESYKHLPLNMRNADLTMVAGAYKTGAIAMMDKDANIVDLGFSRSGSAYGFVHGVANDYPTNTPVLDEFHYRTSILGYLVEDTKDYYIRCGNNSRTITSPNNVDIVNNGSVDFHNPIQIVERDDDTAVRHSFNVQVRYGKESSLVDYQSIIRLSEFLNFDNSTVNRSFLSRTVLSFHAFTFNKGLPPTRNGYGQTVGMINHPNRYLNFDYNEAWSAFATQNTANETSNHNLGGNAVSYIGQLGKYTSIMPFYNNISVPTTRAIADIINEVPLKFASSSTFLGSDLLSSITLTSDSIIHIKTAKGVQEFIHNAGSFNLNDYVIDDKLICFAIKYMNDDIVETFIDNLTLDGSYTFDETVIRDSWNELKSEIINNLTIRIQFCNSEYIVLPYAYKTGYVGAMNLSDGSIVDIEFERSGSAYGIIDEFILYNSHEPVIDKELTENKDIGYLIEEGSMNRHTGVIQQVSTTVTGSFRNFNTPYTFTGTTVNARLQNISEIGHTYVSPYKLQFTYIVKPIESNTVPLVSIRSMVNASQFIDVNGIDIDGNIINITKSGSVSGFEYEIFKIKDKIFVNILTNDLTTTNSTTGSAIWACSGTWVNAVIGDKAEFLHFQRNLYYGDYTLNNIHRKVLVPNTTCSKDFLNTTSYSKITTVGVRTGIKTGSHTDPQTLVQNDKVKFIFLKQ